jgi:hypothetical protein
MIRTALQEPGAAGTYDAETSLAGLNFHPRYLKRFLEPTPSTWRQLLAAYHEWAHHYQFHATTYGYLYRLISNTQLLLVNGALRVAEQERGQRRLSLPLATSTSPLSASASHPNETNLRLITLLQTQRDGVLGFGQHVDMKDMNEWLIAGRVMGEMFGGPQTVVLEPTYMPVQPEIRYPITHLLETHAHLLSSIWLTQAVGRMDGDVNIARAAAEHANEQFVGPYSAFMDFVPGLTGSPQDRAKLFCALAEVALNPPGIHRHPQASWEQMISPLYTSWYPVVRLESLMARALEGHISPPATPWPGDGRELLDSIVADRARMGDVPGAFLPEADGAVAGPTLERAVQRILRYAAIENDAPLELLAFQLDGLAKLCIAEELKQQFPMLLAGSAIEELILLANHLGGPSARCRDQGASWTLIGACCGLQRLGLLSPGTLDAGSDAIVNRGAPIAHALQLLLLRSRAELERIAEEPLLGMKAWTLRSVLAEHYSLALSDFD